MNIIYSDDARKRMRQRGITEPELEYILEDPIKEDEATITIELNENIILDFDNKGKLLGVEILDASKILNKRVFVKAQTM